MRTQWLFQVLLVLMVLLVVISNALPDRRSRGRSKSKGPRKGARRPGSKHRGRKAKYKPKGIDLQTSNEQGSFSSQQQIAGHDVFYQQEWHPSGSSQTWNIQQVQTEQNIDKAFSLEDLLEEVLGGGRIEKPQKRPKPKEEPHSGQWIRLNSTRSYLNSGLVEVYSAGQWGFVCNSGWDMVDASVACRQLGFARGAAAIENTEEELPAQHWPGVETILDDIHCKGSENSLQQCSYSTQAKCSRTELASVLCHGNEGCPEGWVAGNGKCYKLFSKATGIKMAGSTCAQNNASLVVIETAEENHFISNLIKNSVPDSHLWYTGGKKSKGQWKWFKLVERKAKSRKRSKSRNKRKRKKSRSKSKSSKAKSKFKTVRTVVEKEKWFPGWPSENEAQAEPANKRKFDCLTLSDQYWFPKSGNTVVDYFFWKASKCRQRGGIDFICQRDAKGVDKPQEVKESCYNGNGTDYRGTVAVTEKGSRCLNWDVSPRINSRVFPGKGLGDHNHCRNPDNDSRPWCWVDHVRSKFGFCRISKCSDVTEPPRQTPTTTEAPDLNCRTEEFYCEKEKRCIPASFHCDNENDCFYGEDEANCEYTLSEFTLTEDMTLNLNARTLDERYVTETYIEISNEICAQKCRQSTRYICRSFAYDPVKRTCGLSKYNTQHGVLRPSSIYDFYELNSQRSCAGKFMCANGFCVDNNLKCDGKDDCKDFSDEISCLSGDDDSPVTVRLVGGEENSGTVELTYRGSTGVVCDHHWTIEDANVICRTLGYRRATRATTKNTFEYQRENPVFLLDDVKCTGSETSIKDCPKKPWKTHDCEAYEIAGVECQVSKHCGDDQLKCRNQQCVEAYSVCDRIDDCGDRTDEMDCNSLKFYLVGGRTASEGRLELERNGLRGTICDDSWDDVDATVACRMFRFKYGQALSSAHFGQGSGPIWLENVRCVGNESNLNTCQHGGWGRHDCTHDEDAGIRCSNRPFAPTTPATTTTTTTTTPPTTTRRRTVRPPRTTPPSTDSGSSFSIRLVGGSVKNEGNVEVSISGKSYGICDDYWDNNDATVVCRTLGYTDGGVATTKSFFGNRPKTMILDNVECEGTEKYLDDCLGIIGPNKHDCYEGELAGVLCTQRSEGPPSPSSVTTPSSLSDISGKCGYRPYDFTDLFSGHSRRRRSPIFSSASRYDSSNSDLFAPRTLERRRGTEKVVGGNFAAHGEYPWQVRINRIYSRRQDGTMYVSHTCGAVIISEWWILSAAHCFYGHRKSEFQMVVGDHHKRETDKGEQSFFVEELLLHEKYSDESKDYDIALVKIKAENGRGIRFNNYVQPACLPDSSTSVVEGTKCVISGWGNVSPVSKQYPDVLKDATVPLISPSKCSYLYNRYGRTAYTDRMLCAGYVAGGIDTCDGDSGGPLVCNLGGIYTLMGVTSWGRGCAQPNAPGVYAHVTYFLPWINQQINMFSGTRDEKKLPDKPRA